MELRKRLNISTADPFTLLKVCQLLREIPCGEALELIVEGDRVPDELFKIISPERYQIETQKSGTEPEHVQVIIHKRKTPLPGASRPSGGGGCCS
jgi:hypothetical protein